ncbi:MAG: hypothetical protein LUH05_06860, partial [Candidatus Gastranaerophilales bacterium]|nr:hypothetical protein [Candidatus Gastranaerophilales bacterium]
MSEEGKNKPLLLGEVSMDVTLEEDYEDNVYFEEPEIKSKSNPMININYLENDNNENIQILNREEV